MPEVKSPQKLPDKLSTIVIAVVVIVVLAGFIRLALEHWGYTILIGVVAFAAYYVYSQAKNE